MRWPPYRPALAYGRPVADEGRGNRRGVARSREDLVVRVLLVRPRGAGQVAHQLAGARRQQQGLRVDRRGSRHDFVTDRPEGIAQRLDVDAFLHGVHLGPDQVCFRRTHQHVRPHHGADGVALHGVGGPVDVERPDRVLQLLGVLAGATGHGISPFDAAPGPESAPDSTDDQGDSRGPSDDGARS